MSGRVNESSVLGVGDLMLVQIKRTDVDALDGAIVLQQCGVPFQTVIRQRVRASAEEISGRNEDHSRFAGPGRSQI
jgi:hypothetical protein